MKELKGLERRIRLCECFHLALITPCIALPMALFIREENKLVWLLMTFGTVIPVQLIRFLCDRVEKKSLRVVLSLAVTAAASALTIRHDYWMCYLACCIPMLISGLILPRHKARLIFTAPTLIALIPIILLYALGKIYPEPLLCTVSVVLSAFITLNYFLYVNQTRLRSDIATAIFSLKENASVTGIIRQNRKIVTIFFSAAILILAAVSLLFRTSEPAREQPAEDAGTYIATDETQEPEPLEDKNYRESPASRKLLVDEILDAFPYAIAFLCVAVFVIGPIALLWMLINSITKRKDTPLEADDTMTIEKLSSNAVRQEREHLTGYEKKIRRGYERLIRSRAPGTARLAALTPTELEQTALVTGDGAETIHEIYSRTRYGSDPAGKESYAAFKDAVRALPSVSEAARETSDP